jgi:hemoglobin
MRDIETKADIEALLRKFYEKLLQSEGMQRVFSQVDFEAHFPKIVHFWSFVLLDETGYKTNVFEKHVPLPIQTAQFDEWLGVFISTVDNLFTGEKAELAKQRATVLAYTFKSKWETLKGKN